MWFVSSTRLAQPSRKLTMEWDKYIRAFDLIQRGRPSPTITDIKIMTHDQWHQVFLFTFDDGAILKFENKARIPGQLFAGPPPKLSLQIVKPPDENKDEFKIGEIYVP
jgi:hypothetical protein